MAAPAPARRLDNRSVQTYTETEVTPEERVVLARHFTSVDGPVTVLTGLPEATKAALFARYSRTAKPLKRVFLDEFYVPGERAQAPEVGLDKASDLFSRVLSDYGDDSVAQLAGVHVSCEQVSNLLTKVLERGRLMGYLEQSTRYVYYGDRPGGFYRYYRDPALLATSLGPTYVAAMDGLFAAYDRVFSAVHGALLAEIDPADAAAKRAARAAALDVARGLLPVGTISNVGIFGSPQAYEQLVLRLRSEELPEARAYAELLFAELKKVIPDFLTRLERPDRGGAWVEYRSERARGLSAAADSIDALEPRPGPVPPGVALLRWREDAEDAIIANALWSHGHRSLADLAGQVRALPAETRERLFALSVGQRRNRRHRPGREWESADYEFEVISDYGAFRDLQRHRMLTVEWQRLSPALGYEVPPEVADAGEEATWREAVVRAESAFEEIAAQAPAQAPYVLTLAHRIRYLMRMNAREAMHLVELRTSPQGHPSYRRVARDMHAAIRDVAGHRLVAGAMQFVGREDVHLGRLDAERRAESRGAS
jgi:thymidylate synthase ThyX